MKNILIAILIAAVAWLAWLHYAQPAASLPVVQTIEKLVVTEEKYGQHLRAISDSLFAPLDTNSPNPVAELTRLGATAAADCHNGLITKPEAALITGLCTQLKLLNNERERYETEYRGILSRRYDSFDGGFGEERTREHFLTAHLRLWQECTQKYRPIIARDLDRLRRAERQKEIDKKPDARPGGAS